MRARARKIKKGGLTKKKGRAIIQNVKGKDGKSSRVRPIQREGGAGKPLRPSGENHSRAARDKRCRFPALRGMGCPAPSEKTRWNRARAPLTSVACRGLLCFSAKKHAEARESLRVPKACFIGRSPASFFIRRRRASLKKARRSVLFSGWGDWIRTNECRSQSPVP